MILSELQRLLDRLLEHADLWLHSLSTDQSFQGLATVTTGDNDLDHSSDGSLFQRLRETYGGNARLLGKKLEQLKSLCALFEQHFGNRPVQILRAPARINILGEHVDYVSYVPTASLTFGSREHDMMMISCPSDDAAVRGISTLKGSQPFSFELNEGPKPGTDGGRESQWACYLFSRPAPASDWRNYAKGAVFFAVQKYGGRIRQGFNFVVDSSIPAGGGASSSSTLTVLAGAAIRQVNQISFSPAELAQDSAQAEWFLGTRGGDMDHRTICLARRQHAIHLSYEDSQVQPVPMPGRNIRWVTFFSHPADKGKEVMLEYNERAAVSRQIIPAIIRDWSVKRPSLYSVWQEVVEEIRKGSNEVSCKAAEVLAKLPESVTLDEAKGRYPSAFEECERVFPALVRERRGRPLKVRQRALHHLGEVRRVAAARVLIQQEEVAKESVDEAALESMMARLGKLLKESHDSLRDLYDLCTPEVNRLASTIESAPGIYGARLMGGGFGGNILVLTSQQEVVPLISHVQSQFYASQGRNGLSEGAIMVSTQGDGLSELVS